MATKWKLKCIYCNIEETFGDEKDVSMAKWEIIAWNVSTGLPIVICKNCKVKK